MLGSPINLNLKLDNFKSRFLFYEDWEENYRMRKTYMEELERKFDEASESDSVSVDTNTSER